MEPFSPWDRVKFTTIYYCFQSFLFPMSHVLPLLSLSPKIQFLFFFFQSYIYFSLSFWLTPVSPSLLSLALSLFLLCINFLSSSIYLSDLPFLPFLYFLSLYALSVTSSHYHFPIVSPPLPFYSFLFSSFLYDSFINSLSFFFNKSLFDTATKLAILSLFSIIIFLLTLPFCSTKRLTPYFFFKNRGLFQVCRLIILSALY